MEDRRLKFDDLWCGNDVFELDCCEVTLVRVNLRFDFQVEYYGNLKVKISRKGYKIRYVFGIKLTNRIV